MKEKTLVVMAAGMGSRFGGLKQIEPVGPNGEFIIDYSVYDALRAGFTKVVFVIKKDLYDVFSHTIGKRLEKKIKVCYAFQEIDNIPIKKYLANRRNKPWGTVQAVLSARPYVLGDFVVINADDFYGYDSYVKASSFLDNNYAANTYACITFPYQVTSSLFGSVKRAVCFLREDNILKLVESSMTTYNDYVLAVPLNGDKAFKMELNHPVSVNMFAFKNNFFQYLDDYFRRFLENDDEFVLNNEALLPDVIKERLETGEIVLKNLVSDGIWLGMTYKDDLNGLKNKIGEMVKKGDYPSELWK